jgi:hypothetical protein
VIILNLNVIKIYINGLTKDDVKSFLKKESITLNDTEFDYLFNILKKDYGKILNSDKELFLEIKENINEDAYNKLINIFNKYSELYLK